MQVNIEAIDETELKQFALDVIGRAIIRCTSKTYSGSRTINCLQHQTDFLHWLKKLEREVLFD